jgi:hypothetical protein
MQWKRWMLLLALLSVAGLGCGGATDNAAPPAEGEAQEAATAAQPQLEPPAAAVAEFLGAVRVGDDVKVASLLTPTARTQVAELGYQVAPTKSDTATFDIGEVQYLEGGGARVVATWSDFGTTDEMLWMLRSGNEGWRIAGMAAAVIPGEPPLLLDFENLQEAMNKIRLLRASMEENAARLQAKQPAPPQDAVRR